VEDPGSKAAPPVIVSANAASALSAAQWPLNDFNCNAVNHAGKTDFTPEIYAPIISATPI